MNKALDNLVIENARIIFRNFSGKEGKYNREGQRNFCVIIDDEKLAGTLAKDGWNVKALQPHDENEAPRHYISVAVSFKNSPPKIYMVARKKKTLLDEETVNTLDYADIHSADIVISPYLWEVNGKTGVKAYLKTMYVTIEEDVFADKYEEDPDGVPF